jgi:hypothetical protein
MPICGPPQTVQTPCVASGAFGCPTIGPTGPPTTPFQQGGPRTGVFNPFGGG